MPKRRNHFMGFLKRQYAEENLTFWIAVQRYKDICSRNPSPEVLGQIGSQIVRKYIAQDSDSSININQRQREKLLGLKSTKFKPTSFRDVEEEVLSLMETNFINNFFENERNYNSEYTKENKVKNKRKTSNNRMIQQLRELDMA